MIQIEKVGKYGFPTIDFKFQNTGLATAFLWQFVIEVLEAEIDITPYLSFNYKVGGGRYGSNYLSNNNQGQLSVNVSNMGWGRADNCEIVLDHPILNQFFKDEQRCFRGSIDSAENKEIINLSSCGIKLEYFEHIHRKLMEESKEQMENQLPEYLEWNKHMNTYGPGYLEESYKKHQIEQRTIFETKWTFNGEHRIPIDGELKLLWKTKDIKNIPHEGIGYASASGHDHELYLTPSGFVFCEHWFNLCAAPSDTTYCTMIEPSLGIQERIYPISRKIPPLDVERFHIMIGATKSCYLLLRFKFSIDKSTVISSKEFNLHIDSLIGHNSDYQYLDGEALERNNISRKIQLNEDEVMKLKKHDQKLDNSMLIKHKNYPFIKP